MEFDHGLQLAQSLGQLENTKDRLNPGPAGTVPQGSDRQSTGWASYSDLLEEFDAEHRGGNHSRCHPFSEYWNLFQQGLASDRPNLFKQLPQTHPTCYSNSER